MAKYFLETLAFLLLYSSCTAFAKENRVGESCDLSITGSPGRVGFLAFDRELRVALSMQDPVVVSFLVDFPLRVNHAGTSISIEEAATLRARFQEILPEVVRSDVLGQDPETFFCNWTGLMYGKGEIWIRATDQRYTVSAINLPLEIESERSRTTPRLIFVCKADEPKGCHRYRCRWKHPLPSLDHATVGYRRT